MVLCHKVKVIFIMVVMAIASHEVPKQAFYKTVDLYVKFHDNVPCWNLILGKRPISKSNQRLKVATINIFFVYGQ